MKLPITVRMYDVGFGDCLLLTLDGEPPFRILFDCGRHAGSRPPAAGELTFDDVVAGLVADVTADGKQPSIDLVVVTHRHRDHVHGFSRTALWDGVTVGEVWMPWVEDPADQHARRLSARQEQSARRTLSALRALRRAAGEEEGSRFDAAIEIAYNSTTNRKAMDLLHHGLVGRRRRFLPRLGYLPDTFRASELAGLPRGVALHVLGPSRDPAVITALDPPVGAAYEPLTALGALAVGDADEMTDGAAPQPFGMEWVVDGGEYALDETRRREIETTATNGATAPLELAYRLDRSLNGTSLVIVVEVGDVKLLFPGDAQWGTWRAMLDHQHTRALLDGTTLYKVGHHGSHNATPREFVEQHLRGDSLVSVGPTSYSGGWQDIPLPALLAALGEHGQVRRSDLDTPAGKPYVQLRIEADVEGTTRR